MPIAIRYRWRSIEHATGCGEHSTCVRLPAFQVEFLNVFLTDDNVDDLDIRACIIIQCVFSCQLLLHIDGMQLKRISKLSFLH